MELEAVPSWTFFSAVLWSQLFDGLTTATVHGALKCSGENLLSSTCLRQEMPGKAVCAGCGSREGFYRPYGFGQFNNPPLSWMLLLQDPHVTQKVCSTTSCRSPALSPRLRAVQFKTVPHSPAFPGVTLLLRPRKFTLYWFFQALR